MQQCTNKQCIYYSILNLFAKALPKYPTDIAHKINIKNNRVTKPETE